MGNLKTPTLQSRLPGSTRDTSTSHGREEVLVQFSTVWPSYSPEDIYKAIETSGDQAETTGSSGGVLH